MLTGKTYLITGIADEHSLAMYVAKKIKENGGQVICTGLGVSQFHDNLSDKAKSFLDHTFKDFQDSVHQELGKDTMTEILDVSLEASIQEFCDKLKSKNIKLDGFLHAIAMDKTIRNKVVKPLLDVTFQEFCDAMEVSAYSLISLTSHLFKNNLLNADASICSLSYIAASKVTFHPYRNISIAKAALERITVELADEMGRKNGTRVNCIRFSPYMGSKAGNATLNEKDVEFAHRKSPLGNALPEDLAFEVLNLLRPKGRTTGEIRHVDGGYNIMG
ncbi:SDR family oxidoreductase [Psychroflexus gondwanensis]|jgi:enoyl-[acyl-carrier protein] reductase I|uniref:SDR family oxidoreductase n=1 Tax=Psychroflexus gondwanensis TaxID=251 RepID=UPI0011BFCDFF|nr:SDR family oxidoreductase [Psychroflexus gondwanensis]TXE20936.1 SDR family oxidoreductase [Psychroflexus gondwanensis]